MLNALIDKIVDTMNEKTTQVLQNDGLTADELRELAEMADSLFKLKRANRIIERLQEDRQTVEGLSDCAMGKNWREQWNKGRFDINQEIENRR
jgi:hypothetical protein